MRLGSLIVFVVLWSYGGIAQDKHSDSFVLKVLEMRIEITSPSSWNDHLSVIIENKTLADLLGKIVTNQGKLVSFVSIQKNKFQSIELTGKISKKEQVFFVPLSPPFQEFELKVGSRPYEIPPQR